VWQNDRVITSIRLAVLSGAWFNFIVARVPDTPTALRVGERPPDANGQSQKAAEGLRLGYRFLAARDLAVARR